MYGNAGISPDLWLNSKPLAILLLIEIIGIGLDFRHNKAIFLTVNYNFRSCKIFTQLEDAQRSNYLDDLTSLDSALTDF